jgi:hypothetical protein
MHQNNSLNGSGQTPACEDSEQIDEDRLLWEALGIKKRNMMTAPKGMRYFARAYPAGMAMSMEKVVRDQMASNITQAQTLNSLYDVSFKTIRQQLTTVKSIAIDQATGSGDSSLHTPE